MRSFRGIRNCVAFLTIVPLGMDADGLVLAAEFMPIFPLIGGFVSLIGGAATWALESVVSPLLAATLGLGAILLLNGIQHLDGLLDFGDGMMCHGSRSRKLSVMRDPQTGAGGFALGFVVLASTVFAIADLNRALVIQALIVGETAAKFSMVIQAWMGKPARKGLSSIFVAAMHSRTGHVKMTLSTFLVLLIAVPLLGVIGLLVTLSVVIVACVVLIIANNAFGGLTGDVMGATNEMARLVSLLVILAGTKWA